MPSSLDYVSVPPAETVDSVIIWMHGLGADGYDFEPLVPDLGLPRTQFIFPHAPIRPVTVNNGMAMRAWYDFRTFEFSRGEDLAHIDESLADIQQLIAQISTDFSLSTGRIVLAGFSQGGVMALLAGLSSEERYAGVLALSTYLPAAALPDPLRCQPVMQCHGTADPVIPLAVGEEAAKLLAGTCAAQHQFKDYPMAHQLCAEEVADIRTWLRERLA